MNKWGACLGKNLFTNGGKNTSTTCYSMCSSLVCVKCRKYCEDKEEGEWRLCKNAEEVTSSWSLTYKWDFALMRGRSGRDIPGTVWKKSWCIFLKNIQSFSLFYSVFIEHLLYSRHTCRALGYLHKQDKDRCPGGTYVPSVCQGCCAGFRKKSEQPHLHGLSGRLKWRPPPRQLSLTCSVCH